MTKLQLAFKERRTSARQTLTGLMPGRLFVIANDKTLSARPVDVSEKGLGVLLGEKLEEGVELGLAVEKKKVITLRVVWCKEDFGKRDLYRYGLECKDSTINLMRIFSESGCLKDDV
ncbi:MAG: hypothetical protein RIQ81_2035 [Pseudomonadota bacterium]